MLKINEHRVTTITRKSPQLLVLQMADATFCNVAGNSSYLDNRETEYRRTMVSNEDFSETVCKYEPVDNKVEPVKNKSVLVANMPSGIPEMQLIAPAGECLPLPRYSFGDCKPAMVANAGDEEGLSLPVYDFSKFK